MQIQYSGEYPCLCGGCLSVEIDGKWWEFPSFCMSSGGSCFIDEDGDEVTTYGEWEIDKYPEGFPEDKKEEVLQMVNEQVEFGCCGGCI